MNVRGLVVFSAMLGLVACSTTDDDDLDDEKAATTLEALDLGTSDEDLDDVASSEPSSAAAGLCTAKVDGCRTRTCDAANPNVVHVTLTHCEKGFDHHDVSGHLTITFSPNADGTLHSETVSDGLTVDGRPLARTVSANVTLSGNTKTIARHGEKVGTKPNGEPLVHVGDAIVVVDRTTHCRSVTASGTATIGEGRKLVSKITSLQTCETPDGEDTCPIGTVESVNEAKQKTVTKTFDGSPTVSVAIVKPKREKAKSWTLDCRPR